LQSGEVAGATYGEEAKLGTDPVGQKTSPV
jgi:hypothetical protein